MKYNNDYVKAGCDMCGDATSLNTLARNHGLCDDCVVEREAEAAVEREADKVLADERRRYLAEIANDIPCDGDCNAISALFRR